MPVTLDIFNDDAFSTQSLTEAINEQEEVPGRLRELGLFDEKGMTTTSMSIEKKGNTLALVPAAERGANGRTKDRPKRQMIPFPSIHLPTEGAVMADQVQNVRAFGEETELETVQAVVNEELADMRQDLDATLEWQRIGALQGKILDADGTTELVNLFTAFNITQQSQDFDLANNTKVKTSILQAMNKVESIIGHKPMRGYRVFASNGFWESFIEHASIEKAFDRWMEGSFLRQDPRAAFNFAGVNWERYTGSVGNTDFIPDGEAFLVPEGLRKLFITRFAPADYVETVNTMGLPYYAKQERMKFDKGIELEAQSNPATICTRPDLIIKLTA